MRTYHIKSSIGDDVDIEAEIEVDGKDTGPYFDREFGNYLPGEDREVEIVWVRVLQDEHASGDIAGALRLDLMDTLREKALEADNKATKERAH